ncbi:MAG: nicotinate-nucleotide adenylyltransferase [Gammaproteobacteria bacterium]
MIGILGGTFDPVHFGHLRPALEVQEALALQELRLVPCHIPPHRPQPYASAAQRVAMLEAAVGRHPAFRIDTRELQRNGPSYTFDTLMSLREELGDAGLCLLLGMDAFGDLTTWHRWDELIELCHLVVMTRPGADVPAGGELAGFIRRHRVPAAAGLQHRPAGRLLFQPVTALAISASRLRALLAEDLSPAFLMPEAVIDIINREGLYRGT